MSAAVKVLHVDSGRLWRGGQNQVLLCAQGMAARGHDVLLACQSGGALEERARAVGLPVRALSFSGDLSPRAAFDLAGIVRETRPQIVHMHDSHALAAGFLGARGLLRVVTRRVDFRLRGVFSRWKYGSCDRVIGVSRKVAELLRADGLEASRLRIVHDGVPDRAPAPGGEAALVALGVPPGVPVVGNVAALVDHKDQLTLLEAAARVRQRLGDVRFVIVGEGELRAKLEARALALGLRDRVIFTGFRADLDVLIPAFTLFCMSSHLEGLGTSLLDAMCFGRAVVATAAGGMPEAIDDGRTGRLVPMRDADALAAALVDVLQDDVGRAAMGAAGRARFLAEFTADRMVEGTLDVYRELGSQ